MRPLFPALLAIGLSALLSTSPSYADQYRRPGLGGPFATRQLTTPYNALSTIIGPGHTPLFGQNYRNQVGEAGLSYNSQGEVGEELWLRVGAAFGLFPHLEAGALFLPIRLAPSVEVAGIITYITYGFTFGPLDVGARLSFSTPVGSSAFSLNPGVPVLLRLGRGRIDSGIFINPELSKPVTVGMHVPFRYVHNLTPRIFAGLSTGFHETTFGSPSDTTISAGFLGGYTQVFGSRVFDFTTQFTWDRLLLLDPPSGSVEVIPGAYRLELGVTFHQLVI